MSRRHLLGSLGAGGAALALPAWARGMDMGGRTAGGGAAIRPGFDEVRGPDIALTIGSGHRTVAGRSGPALAVNGSIPGPLVRLKEGQRARIAIHNTLETASSIHWHGLLVPFQMDGVPGVSFPGIPAGGHFTAEFEVRQSGTYWWHSHSGLQEQSGHYGPIVIDPAEDDPDPVERDYILLLSEFTPMDPHRIMDRLKKGDDYFSYQQTTWTDDYPLSGADRRMWARMRMSPTDILDVRAPAYTYLANGRGPDEGTEFAFQPGERVRLRIINGSAMTFFNVRIPGLAMQVVAADGQPVVPVETDEFQIGVAETYDVIVTPRDVAAYTIVAESMGRSGMAVATLASRPGARAPVPSLRPAPLLTMADMGMSMGHDAMGHGAAHAPAPMDHAAMGHGEMGHGAAMAMPPASGSAPMKMTMKMRDTARLPAGVKVGPGIDMVSAHPADRMGDPGIGLSDVGHRVLTYRDLAARSSGPGPEPTRKLQIHLTGNMERYMWSFDGRKFSAVSDDPIRFAWNERVRVTLVNDTMMAHPIHLHGHFFELVNGQVAQPRKHTVIVQPGGSATFDLTADAPGDWAFHCHLLYHMHAGMMQVVSVAGPEDRA